MKFVVSYTQKNGTKVNGQLYSADGLPHILKNLQEWGAREIIIKSIDDESEG